MSVSHKPPCPQAFFPPRRGRGVGSARTGRGSPIRCDRVRPTPLVQTPLPGGDEKREVEAIRYPELTLD